MPADIPEQELTEVVAGDTVKWTRSLSDYPASTWTLKYLFRGPSEFEITATGSGSTHTVNVAKATTALWPKGLYTWIAIVTSSTERYKIFEGELTVQPNLETNKASFETKSINKQILEALEATALNNAGRGEMQYRIEAAGRLHVFYTHADLITAIEKYRSWVLAEEEAKAIARGENTGKNIFVRFT